MIVSLVEDVRLACNSDEKLYCPFARMAIAFYSPENMLLRRRLALFNPGGTEGENNAA
jgi:hypothetical protein